MTTRASVLAIFQDKQETAALAALLPEVEVYRAADLFEAALRQSESPSSVVVCDADDMDWHQATWLFHNLAGEPAVVFLTKRADECLWLDMLQEGAYDLLEKPYRPEDLRWVIDSAIRRSATH